MPKLFIQRLETRLPLAADFNGDDTVDNLDLDRWEGTFGETMATPRSADADADGDVDGNDFVQWQRGLGTLRDNLIAYRPQFVQDDTPIPAPRYSPLVKTPVREADEASATLGPGIRINWDDDNNNGVPDASDSGVGSRENDLIEVKISVLNGLDLVLIPDSRLRLYYDFDKSQPIPMNGSQTVEIPFLGAERTVWVEWAADTHSSNANLHLVNHLSNTTLDTVRFHSFRSMIVVFGGNTQDPGDSDGDGSIGDRVEMNTANREGIFDLAQELYETGWDVMPFNEEDVDATEDVPFTEIVNGHANRFLDAHMIMGYSQGGGATHDLIERLWDEADLITRMGVFLDAVDHDGALAENDWPDVTFYLLNIYQQHEGFMGGDIDDNEVLFGATMDEVNITETFPAVGHTEIDQLDVVHDIIKGGIADYLINR